MRVVDLLHQRKGGMRVLQACMPDNKVKRLNKCGTLVWG